MEHGFADVLATLLRYAPVILGLALLVGVGMIVSASREGRLYAAESAFVLDNDKPAMAVSGIAAQFGLALPSGGDAQSPGFFADLLRSPTILRPIVDSGVVVATARGAVPLHLTDSIQGEPNPAIRRYYALQQLRNRISADATPRTGVVTLRVLDPSPLVALAINRRMLELVNEFNVSRRRNQASQQRSFLEERLAQARQQLHSAEEQLRIFLAANRAYVPSSEASFERQRLERDLSTSQQVYLSLLQSFEQARVEEIRAAPLITVIQAPELPVGPEPRRLARKGIVGFLIGAVLGLFIAYLSETIRRARLEYPAQTALVAGAFHDLRRNWWRPWRAVRRPSPRMHPDPPIR